MTTKYVTMEVTVTVEYPDNLTLENEDIISAAMSSLSQSYEIDVGPMGTIVWAKCFSEVHEEDCEVSDFA